MKTSKPLNMVSLFAGIGGFELAFQKVGIHTSMVCEIDTIAAKILKTNFPNASYIDDVCTINELPKNTDILCAGFPCQDLSSVGIKKGMKGTRSSLVTEVFRILKNSPIEWVVFENVSFMLSLGKGETIKKIADELENLGYNWAYRLIDSISFVHQHRSRVFIIASLHHDPRSVILSDDIKGPINVIDYQNFSNPIGFYWTEGKYALGLVSNGLPTLKAGSTIGIPSPPAIIFPNGEVSTPDIRDAERLQGFPIDWTICAEEISKPSIRWKLIGNAVTVDTVKWLASKIISPKNYDSSFDKPFDQDKSWPKAAWSYKGERCSSSASPYPTYEKRLPLTDFLQFPRTPLSLKATLGFEHRLKLGNLRYPEYFILAIQKHIKIMQEQNG